MAYQVLLFLSLITSSALAQFSDRFTQSFNSTLILDCTGLETGSASFLWKRQYNPSSELSILKATANKFIIHPNGTLVGLKMRSYDTGYYICMDGDKIIHKKYIFVEPEEKFCIEGQSVPCWLPDNLDVDKSARYIWTKSSNIVKNVTNEKTVYYNGTIVFYKTDTGLFKCFQEGKEVPLRYILFNPKELESYVEVTVRPPDTVDPGQEFYFECSSSGNDYYMSWKYLLNNKVVYESEDNRSHKQKFSIQSTSNVTCQLVGNREVKKFKTFIVRIRQDPRLSPGTCIKYNGNICLPYLSTIHTWKYPVTNYSLATTLYEKVLKMREKELKIVFDQLDSAGNVNLSSMPGDSSSIKWNSEHLHSLNICIDRLKRLICASAYPQCHWVPSLSRLMSKGLPVCREHCSTVLLHYCSDFWSDGYLGRFVSAKNLGTSLKESNVVEVLKPSCFAMPKNISSACAPINLEPELKTNQNLTKLCYNKNRGEFYRGHAQAGKNSTKKCLPWINIPTDGNNVELSPLVFPSLLIAGNNCRNPGQVKKRPFCILASTPHIPQECPTVRRCDDPITTEPPKVIKPPPDLLLGMPKPIFIGAIVVVLLLILVCIVIFLLLNKRVKRKNKSKLIKDLGYTTPLMPPAGQSVTPTTQSGCLITSAKSDVDSQLKEKLTLNKLYKNEGGSLYLDPRLEKLQYQRNVLTDIRELGNCSYGEVILSKAPNLPLKDSTTKISNGSTSNEQQHNEAKRVHWVAVKVLKTDATAELQKSFMEEAAKLAGFNHQNIIRILGICTPIKPLCLLLEYMVNGDLNSFLKTYNPHETYAKYLPEPSDDPNSDNYPTVPSAGYSPRDKFYQEAETKFMNGHVSNNSSSRGFRGEMTQPAGRKLDKLLLTKMAMGISDAMAYISNNCFVHRDLAARNCLVGDQYQVKLSDFSLCKPIYRQQDFIGEEDEMVPIRWLPLESITESRFNVDTDVWSYGIFLWELFSYGESPYPNMTPEQVVDFLQSEHILARPEHCPVNIHKLMESCWNFERKSRPTFSYLTTKLGELLRRWNENSPEMI